MLNYLYNKSTDRQIASLQPEWCKQTMDQNMNKLDMYTKEDDIVFCPVQPLKKTHVFPIVDLEQIEKAVYSSVSIEIMIKHIHYKFNDEGLRYTLIHQLYSAKSEDLEFFIPELVYIAVKKQCKPMKRLLTYRAASNQGLRRLILWNLKAFTVLMKERDAKLKEFVDAFEDELAESSKNINKFNHAEKCIAMLTTASLILKTFQKQEQKPRLQRFIQRFNTQHLNNLQHAIMIPFRKDQTDLFHSNYVVRIVEEDCSCFPTRKRVPYRIFIETIDPTELIHNKPDESFFKQEKAYKQKPRDLFNEVVESVEKTLSAKTKSFIVPNSKIKYPFVVDQEQYTKISKFVQFAKAIQQQEKQNQKEKMKQSSLKEKLTKSIFRTRSIRQQQKTNSQVSGKLRPHQTSNHQRFYKTYLPTIPSSSRKSVSVTNAHEKILFTRQLNQTKMRWSQQRPQQNEIKMHSQQLNWSVQNDNSGTVWGELMTKKIQKYKKNSYFHNFKSLKLHNVVVKGGDDLRQEIICMQLIYKIKEILVRKGINVIIKPYQIIVLSENSGILEFVANSISIDGLKKSKGMDLTEFFKATFKAGEKYQKAKENFVRSLAGSSVLTYILKLKDRHNGNILLDCQGNIIHIDFGFILGLSPGGLNFESSPFKLTEQYVDLMGGTDSEDYKLFTKLFCDSMQAIRTRVEELCLIIEIMKEESDLECFQRFEISVFKDRFKPWISQEKYRNICLGLVQKSCMNARTVNYDYFQYFTNGIES